MRLEPGTREIGPGQGSLLVRTYREGVAARVGHDLVIEVGEWRARLDVGDDGAVRSLQMEADPRSLEVREGLHGVKPLTASDRAEIRANIDRKVLGGQPIEFRSHALDAGPDGLAVEGDLTLAGTTRPVAFVLQPSGGRVRGTATLRQSEWGIRPYRGLMGALRVRDDVEVAVDAEL